MIPRCRASRAKQPPSAGGDRGGAQLQNVEKSSMHQSDCTPQEGVSHLRRTTAEKRQKACSFNAFYNQQQNVPFITAMALSLKNHDILPSVCCAVLPVDSPMWGVLTVLVSPLCHQTRPALHPKPPCVTKSK